MRVYTLVCLFFLLPPVFAQVEIEFSRVFSSPDWTAGLALLGLPDGGYLVGGVSSNDSTYLQRIVLNRTDAQGQPLWSRTIGGSERSSCSSLIQAQPYGFLLVGASRHPETGAAQALLLHTSEAGDSLWSRSFGDGLYCSAARIVETMDLAYVMAGTRLSADSSSHDFWLQKIDTEGEVVWSRTYDSPGDSHCTSVVQAQDGGFLLVGASHAYGSEASDFYAIRTDPTGVPIWSHVYGSSRYDACRKVCRQTDGGFVLAGRTWVNPLDHRYMAVRINADGDSLWTRTYGGGNATCETLAACAQGGVLLGGTQHQSDEENNDVWLVRLDPSGDSLWTSWLGDVGAQTCTSMLQDASGAFVFCGTTQISESPTFDAWLVRTTADPVAGLQESLHQDPGSLSIRAAPNPFNASTTLVFSVPRAAGYEVVLYDILGRPVRESGRLMLSAGEHRYVLDLTGQASGRYFCRIRSGRSESVHGLTLVR